VNSIAEKGVDKEKTKRGRTGKGKKRQMWKEKKKEPLVTSSSRAKKKRKKKKGQAGVATRPKGGE